jgi:hypothetical protein
LYHATGLQQAPHTGRSRAIDRSSLGERHLVNERTDLQSLDQAEPLEQCEVRRQNLCETAGQRLIRRVTDDVQREDGHCLRVRGLLRELGLMSQRNLCSFIRTRTLHEHLSGTHSRRTTSIGMGGEERTIGIERLFPLTVTFETLPDNERRQRVVRCEVRSTARNTHRAVALAGRK